MSPGLKTPASRLSYDVLVFGSQLAGAVTSALLARRGYRVLAVLHDALPSAYRDGDFLLPCAPVLLPPLRSLPLANAVLEELGLATDVLRALAPTQPLQILAEQARLDLPKEPERRAAELQRQFGASGRGLSQSLDHLLSDEEADAAFYRLPPPMPAKGLVEGFRLKRTLAAHASLHGPGTLPDADGLLGRGLRELWRLGGYLWDELPPSRASLRPLAQLLRGLHLFPGGADGLALELRRRVTASGGKVLESDDPSSPPTIQELAISTGRITHARIEGSPHEYRAAFFVAATAASDLRELLPAMAAEGKLAGLLAGVKTRSCLLSLNLVVAEEGLPPGLGPAAICLPSKESSPSVFVQVSPAQRADSQATPQRVVQISRQVPAGLHAQGEGHVKAMLRDLREASSEFLPFLDRHVLKESSPALQEESGLAARLRAHPLIEVGLPRTLGVTGLPSCPPCKNLVLASREVLPGLGLEGEFMAGVRAAEIVQSQMPKKEILR